MISGVAGRRGREAVRRRLRRAGGERRTRSKQILNAIPGAADVSVEQVTGQPVLQIKLNQEQLARYGVPAQVVLDLVESIGSKPLGEVIEGQLRFPLVVRLPDSMRDSAGGDRRDPDADRRPASGFRCRGWPTSRWSKGRRRSRASGASGGSPSRPTSAAATWAASWPRPSSRSTTKLTLPPGRYRVEYGGQFEHLQRARTRLMIVVPLALRADLRAAVRDLSATWSTRCACSPACRSAGSAASSPCGCATCRSRSRRRSASSPCPAWPCWTT